MVGLVCVVQIKTLVAHRQEAPPVVVKRKAGVVCRDGLHVDELRQLVDEVRRWSMSVFEFCPGGSFGFPSSECDLLR